jgi:hypothetical protein
VPLRSNIEASLLVSGEVTDSWDPKSVIGPIHWLLRGSQHASESTPWGTVHRCRRERSFHASARNPAWFAGYAVLRGEKAPDDALPREAGRDEAALSQRR